MALWQKFRYILAYYGLLADNLCGVYCSIQFRVWRSDWTLDVPSENHQGED